MQIEIFLNYQTAHSKAAPYQPNDATISPLLKEVHGLATLDDFAVESPFDQNTVHCTFFQIHPNFCNQTRPLWFNDRRSDKTAKGQCFKTFLAFSSAK